MTTPIHSADSPVMRVHDMTFGYPSRLMFSDWSRDFSAGLTWLRGHNGEGKSTLLKLFAGVLTPRAGTIEVQGIVLGKQPLDYRRKVFWCGPGSIPFEHLTAREFFGFMRGLYPRFDEAALARHVAGFGLDTHLRAALHTLSTGTQRKVWLAAALAAGAAVTLLDEPVNALDADSLAHLLSTLARCATDTDRTWIVASHEHLGEGAALASLLDLSANAGPTVTPQATPADCSA